MVVAAMREHDTLSLLHRLVAFTTVSAETNLPLIDFVADYLAAAGIDAQIVRSPTQPKANLLATIGPADVDGIVLSGHTDVVPVAGQEWATPPFELHVKHGRAYARGSADMKGFIAVVLGRIAMLRKDALRRPLHLALSYDEEIGCLGAPALLDAMRASVPRPRAVIVGEPTDMKVVVGHKGVTVLRTHVRGREAHSSVPQLGLNAIAFAADLISELRQIESDLSASAAGDTRFEPCGSSISVTVIDGGAANNIIPKACSFVWDIRAVPEAPARVVIERFRSSCDSLLARHGKDGLSIETETLAHVPALGVVEQGPAQSLAATLLGERSTSVMSIGSEAGMFQSAGYSAILCGPGSISQAHQPDEYVELEQLKRCESFIDRLIASLSAQSAV
jgi:acetylornithine deacetylase